MLMTVQSVNHKFFIYNSRTQQLKRKLVSIGGTVGFGNRDRNQITKCTKIISNFLLKTPHAIRLLNITCVTHCIIYL